LAHISRSRDRAATSLIEPAPTREEDVVMQVAVVSPLTEWVNFNVVVGTSAATLTGLQFVVITLIAGTGLRRSADSINAFGTPNVVHFCVALAVTAILSAPWQALWNVSLLLGVAGLGGVSYVAIVLRRVLRQSSYQTVSEDWIWYVIFPLVAYVTLVVAAILLPSGPVPILFVIGAASVVLIFIGIHNAWDTVTYVITEEARRQIEGEIERQD
jgi:hypothetical protein